MRLNNIKNNYYKIINIAFIAISVISFIAPFIIVKSNPNNQNSIDFSSVIAPLRFLVNTNTGAALEIATHNWGIAAMVFIVSLYSYGFLGIVPLGSAFFLTSVVIQISPTLPSITFICLEALGMSIAVFLSTYLFEKRKNKDISLIKLYLYSLITLCILFVIYMIAAYIEGGILREILDSMNKN